MIVTNLLTLHNQLKIHHWQTKKYSEHQALDTTYNTIGGLIDEFVEVFMGKRGRVKSQNGFKIELVNYEDLNTHELVEKYITYLTTDILECLDGEKDTDLLNIRDEMIAALNKLKYLLTLE